MMASALPQLPEAVRMVRFDRRMSQQEFAAAIGVYPMAVSRWENGWTVATERLLQIGSMAPAGPAKKAIVEELRRRFAECPIVQVIE